MRVCAKNLLLLALAVLAAVVMFFAGRASVGTQPASPASRSAAYFDGLQAGEAEGRREGRALQEGASLPSTTRRPVQDAFSAGYAAGANDAFAGYDGGWTIGAPYVITIATGSGDVVYRIKDREPMQADTFYYLCADGRSICHEARH